VHFFCQSVTTVTSTMNRPTSRTHEKMLDTLVNQSQLQAPLIVEFLHWLHYVTSIGEDVVLLRAAQVGYENGQLTGIHLDDTRKPEPCPPLLDLARMVQDGLDLDQELALKGLLFAVLHLPGKNAPSHIKGKYGWIEPSMRVTRPAMWVEWE
jgi:hypothetical protein